MTALTDVGRIRNRKGVKKRIVLAIRDKKIAETKRLIDDPYVAKKESRFRRRSIPRPIRELCNMQARLIHFRRQMLSVVKGPRIYSKQRARRRRSN